eukprot:5111776-Prymnesium_polylepis.2
MGGVAEPSSRSSGSAVATRIGSYEDTSEGITSVVRLSVAKRVPGESASAFTNGIRSRAASS